MAKLPYHWALDGISNTQTINPEAPGHSEEERKENLVQVMDGYFDQGCLLYTSRPRWKACFPVKAGSSLLPSAA